MTRRCPYCQQVLPEIRLGVVMPELKARIFDLILRAGDEGIDAHELFVLTYDTARWHGGERSRKTLAAHVLQINDLIEDTGYRIVSRGAGGNTGICGRYYLKNCAAR